MARCNHVPFTVTANLPPANGMPRKDWLEVEFEPDCDEGGCSFVNDLPEEWEDSEIEWISKDEITLHPAGTGAVTPWPHNATKEQA